MISQAVRDCPCCGKHLIVTITILGKVYEVDLREPNEGEVEEGSPSPTATAETEEE